MGAKKRRKRKSLRKRQKKKSKLGIILKIIILLVLFFGFSYWFMTQNILWDKESRLNIVTGTEEGDIRVMVFDPISNEITTLNIPGDTQLEVSRQLGVWKVKSLWKLGKEEGIGGKLMAESVTKNFDIPVYAWISPEGNQLVSPGVKNIAHVLKSYDTNLAFIDRLNLALFSLRVKNFERNRIELENTRVLGSAMLNDGSPGYLLESSVPPNISSTFTDRKMSELKPKIVIKDFGAGNVISNKVARIVEGMGGKVTSISKEREEVVDCEVITTEKSLGEKISSIFSCNFLNSNPSGNFDIEIRLGEGFRKRF